MYYYYLLHLCILHLYLCFFISLLLLNFSNYKVIFDIKKIIYDLKCLISIEITFFYEQRMINDIKFEYLCNKI